MNDETAAKPSVTVADVAVMAGVSKATAARVLGKYGVVSDAVRQKVLQAAAKLDYRPNELARSMTTGRSGAIGVVVADIENPFFSSAVRGIADVARAAGFTVILANSGEKIEAEKAAVKTLLAKRVDGFIVSPSRRSEVDHLNDILRTGRPLALLDRAVPEIDVDTVTVDDREASENATELLLRNGHRQIVYMTACDTPERIYDETSDIFTASVRDRIEGFMNACRRFGVSSPERLVRLGAKGPEDAGRLAKELLGTADRPTAILASHSLIALEVFKATRAMGLSIPDDLSLITFHDADWTSVTTPPVTVINQPVYELGKTVAQLLVERLKGETGPARRVIIPTQLIERSSIAALR
jgi:LacI family transcriptional regulator